MDLLKHELVHLILTSIIAGFFWRKYRDRRLVLITFLFGIFIDIDHFFDYFLYFGLRFNLSEFFNVTTYMGPAQKIYVLFHGWEFLLPLWLFGRWAGKRWKIIDLEWAIAFSYLAHILWDNFTVTARPLAYFFIYRLLNGFSLESFDGFEI